MSGTSLVDISVGDVLVVSATENKAHDLCFHFILVTYSSKQLGLRSCFGYSIFPHGFLCLKIFLHKTLIRQSTLQPGSVMVCCGIVP